MKELSKYPAVTCYNPSLCSLSVAFSDYHAFMEGYVNNQDFTLSWQKKIHGVLDRSISVYTLKLFFPKC